MSVIFENTSLANGEERGATWKEGRGLLICINTRLSMFEIADSVLHEYAHAMTWSTERIESRDDVPQHPPEWGIKFAELWTDWHDFDGLKKSKEY